MSHDQTIRGAIARLSAGQHGVFSRVQAMGAGMHPRTIDRRVAAGEWESVDHAVYRVAGTPPSWRQRLMAACLAGPAVASHRAAAALWGFVDCDEDLVEVTALRPVVATAMTSYGTSRIASVPRTSRTARAYL